MGTVYRKTVTRPLPSDSEIVTHKGVRIVKWTTRRGKSRSAPLTAGKDGTERIVTTAGTYTAKYRDGQGIVREVSTGCKDEQAARRVLGDLERRAELIKSGVMTTAEDAIADHQATPLAEHLAAFIEHLRAKNVCQMRLVNTKSRLERITSACNLSRLLQLSGAGVERWLTAQSATGMSPATRNEYRQALVGFGNWCIQTQRLITNPFSSIPKADVRTDLRRQRRSLTETELTRLIQVAGLRPLAEHGRATVRKHDEDCKGRSTWEKASLTFESIAAAAERGRQRLRANPKLLAKLEAAGRERSLIYKTLILTGLRKGELASLTVGQIELDAAIPFLVLDAANEKNRQGNSLPLRADLVYELRDWLAFKLESLQGKTAQGGVQEPSRLPAATPLFEVPTGLLKILDRDLIAAGIAKRDERGRSVDVHALRHSFGTLLSKGGISPRTAQAALRHSTIDLTMNVYTDPKLLDVHGALDVLPKLPLKLDGRFEASAATYLGQNAALPSLVAPVVAPTAYQPSPLESPPVSFDSSADQSSSPTPVDVNPDIDNKKDSQTFPVNESTTKPLPRFELGTYALRKRRSAS